jgi:ADP-ribosyl-[dinitrogen reductase] hydrolase
VHLTRSLDVALEAARIGGEILSAEFHRPGGPRGAGDKAEADVVAETAIKQVLLAAFPRYGYLGEETGRVSGEAGEAVWLVDPNDGTRDYLKGSRGSAVSIGLLEGRRPVLGVVFAFGYPDDRGDLFAWAAGMDLLQRNGHSVETPLPTGLTSDGVVLLSRTSERDPEGSLQSTEPARYRSLPSIAHRLALVASGEAAATVALYSPGAWDYGAGQALLRAGEGVVVNEAGHEVLYGADGASQTRRAFGGASAVVADLASRQWRAASPSPDLEEPPAHLRPGEAVRDPGLLSRAQGCLLGQMAGDSLGALVASKTSREIAQDHPGGPRLLADGGETLAGQPTDDGEMALTLARSILGSGGYDGEAVLSAYRRWYRSGPLDVAQTTRAALVGYFMASSLANSSLARVSPLGIFGHALAPEAAAALGRADSALTHPNPVCQDAVAAFVVALSHAVRAGDGPRSAYEAARGWAEQPRVEAPVRDAIRAAALSPPDCDGAERGSVLTALRNAFFELLHAPSLEAGVVATVQRGGEADVNAAVAGALLGAVHGRDAVPAQWRKMILSCRAHPARAPRPRPRACWPVDILELAERLALAGLAKR